MPIALQVVGDASVGTVQRQFSVTDANINRLVAWAQAIFRRAGEAPLTADQALRRWMAWTLEQTRGSVLNHEHNNTAPPPFDVA
jgi:hypothetical protein